MNGERKNSFYNPHDSARAESLAGVPLAGFGRRFGAYAIDLALVAFTYLPAIFGLEYLVKTRLGESGEFYHSAHVAAHVDLEMTRHFAWVVWLILYFGLIVWRSNGFTPGKKLFGIRILSLTHPRITLWQSIERALGYGASMLEGGLGFLQYFTARNRCCVHDRIAETIVVNERAMKSIAAESRTAAHAR